MAEERQPSLETQLAVLQNEFKNLKRLLDELKNGDYQKAEKINKIEIRIEEIINEISETMASTYVTKVEWTPIKTLVYGVVGLILSAAIGALLALVIRK